jgi:hypothetical protein
MVHGMMLRMEEDRKSAHDAFILLWKVTSGRFGLGKIYVDDLDGVRRTYEGDPKYTNKKSKIR